METSKLRFLTINQNFSMVSFDIFDDFTGRQSLFYPYFSKIFQVRYEVVRRSNRRGMGKW